MRRRGDNGHRLSEADRFEIQRRVSAGASFMAAAQAVGCSKKSIQRFLARTGGVAAKAWHRSARQLSLAEREELLRGLLAGLSLRAIATRLGRAPRRSRERSAETHAAVSISSPGQRMLLRAVPADPSRASS